MYNFLFPASLIQQSKSCIWSCGIVVVKFDKRLILIFTHWILQGVALFFYIFYIFKKNSKFYLRSVILA